MSCPVKVLPKWNRKHRDEATTLSSQSCCRLWWRLWQQIPLPLSWHCGQYLQFLVPVKLFQFPVQMLRGEGCSLLDDRCQRFSPSGLLSWCVQQCTTDVHPAQWVDTSRTRSPAAANNEAASPEPEDDRIAREVLNFKLSGAEGEQHYSISNPRLYMYTVASYCLYYTIYYWNISDNRCISLRPHTYVLYGSSQFWTLFFSNLSKMAHFL